MFYIKNGYIKTMAGPDIENGAILIDDNGKIAAVGADIPCPEGAQVIDAEGRLVTPGCVDAHCHIGLDNQGMGCYFLLQGIFLTQGLNPYLL